MDLGLAGRRALVTGSSKGIGRAIAAALAAEGARVTGGVERIWQAQLDAFGGADVLVNNVTGGGRAPDPGRVFDDYFGARRPLPAGRFGEPADTGAVVALLCSERAAWVTGTCIDVDGGWVKSIF